MNGLHYKATDELLGAAGENAVASNNIDTAYDRDARAIALKKFRNK